MSGELYYLVGSQHQLKQDLISVLRKSLSGHSSILVPEIYTTDEVVAESDNYLYVDKKNFSLRQSMDIYGLSWEKKGHFYGVCADINQRLNSGVDVIINGSLHNLEQARKRFPGVNIVLLKEQKLNASDSKANYLIAEDDEVRLEWDSHHVKMGNPYVLTMMSGHGMDKAQEMMLSLITYNRNCLEYAG